MTGTTTGQVALLTGTDSDDTESFLTTTLTADLQTITDLFDSTAGHDHSGSGKGAPLAAGGLPAAAVTLTGVQTVTNKTLTSPTLNTPTLTSPTITGGLGIGQAASTTAGIIVAAGAATDGTNRYSAYLAAQSGASGANNSLYCAGTSVFAAAIGIGQQAPATGLIAIGTLPARVAGDQYLIIDASGNVHKSAIGPAS